MGVVLAALAATAALTPSAADLGLRPAYPRPQLTPASLPVPSRRQRAAPDPSGRLLELWVDGKNRNVVGRVVDRQGQLYLAEADARAAGLTVKDAPGGLVPLSALGVTDAHIEQGAQQLLLTTQAGPDRQVLDLGASGSFAVPRSDTGFMARYDLSGLFGQRFGGWSVAAALTGSVFTPRARLDANGWLRLDDDTARFTRLDTAVELTDTAGLRRLTIGDAVSSQLDWSRAVRFAGVQVARDFSLQPDRSTLPTLDYLGQATAPSSIDVFVNATRLYSGQVDAGPFEVRDIPVVTGRGEATIVVRDLLGRAVETTVPLYATTALLAKGLTDYSLEAGALRRDYGLASFGYGPPMAAASVRRGVTDRLTLQAHAEASPQVAVAGLGAAVLAGRVGVAGLGLSASGGEDGSGLLYALSFEGELRGVRLFGSAMGTSGLYRDIAAVEDGTAMPRLRLQAGATLDVGRRGALGGSFVSVRDDERRIDVATASYTYSLPGGWYFGAAGLYDAGPGVWAGQLFLRVPISGAVSATASARNREGRSASSFTLSRRADPDGGLGYALTAEPQAQRAQAEAVWYGAKANGAVAVLSDDGELSARVLASGAVVGMDGSLFASRGTDGAVALVKTGQPDVQVYRENRPVAVTDAKGRALLTGLPANIRNRIGVKITDLPFAAELESGEQVVTPQRRSGVVVDFTPPPTRPVLLVIRLADGQFPAAGSPLTLDSGERLVVGRRGEAFLRDLAAPVAGTVALPQGACRIAVAPPAAAGDTIVRQEVTCAPARS